MKQSIWLCLLSLAVAQAGDWPQYMGPNRDGTVEDPGRFDGDFHLELAWRKPLKSGFSGISIRNDRLYVMHIVGDKDALSCLEVTRGGRLWSYAYGPTFPKVGSSEPGPLSTPAVDEEMVFGLGAHGELFGLDLTDGELVWRRDLIKDHGAKFVQTGVTTSPLVHGDLLYVNVGDQVDKGIAAFKKKTGELVWHRGDENISFHSPTLVTLDGRQQLVSLSDTKMRGLDPNTGVVIWERDGNWLLMNPIGQNHMLLGHFSGISFQRVTFNKVTEVWQSATLQLQYDMPVHYKGFIYGNNAGFLYCLNGKTGETQWSSINAGPGMTILVDGHLALMGDDGTFRIVRASEQDYMERAVIKALDSGGHVEPSYANGVFYVRNYLEMAAIRVKRTLK